MEFRREHKTFLGILNFFDEYIYTILSKFLNFLKGEKREKCIRGVI